MCRQIVDIIRDQPPDHCLQSTGRPAFRVNLRIGEPPAAGAAALRHALALSRNRYWSGRMKTLCMALLAVFSFTTTARGQGDTPEHEFRKFLAEYDGGVARRDIQYLERVISDDYTYTGPNGKVTNRVGTLRHFTSQRDNPANAPVSLQLDNVRVHAVGDMVLVTHDWTTQTTQVDAPDAEPVTDKGRYTGVFEKRNGRWLVIAEHDSERIYDDEWMVSGVRQASREYSRLTERLPGGGTYSDREQSGDIAALRRFLSDEYTYTGPDGAFLNRDQAIARASTDSTATRVVACSEQNVRTIGNGMAIETGKCRDAGPQGSVMSAAIHRYTRTWAFYVDRWQLTANHVSPVTSQDVPDTH
jgi:ketosteroid isomerase-like protein